VAVKHWSKGLGTKVMREILAKSDNFITGQPVVLIGEMIKHYTKTMLGLSPGCALSGFLLVNALPFGLKMVDLLFSELGHEKGPLEWLRGLWSGFGVASSGGGLRLVE
jgi:hypothetical protein